MYIEKYPSAKKKQIKYFHGKIDKYLIPFLDESLGNQKIQSIYFIINKKNYFFVFFKFSYVFNLVKMINRIAIEKSKIILLRIIL